MSMDKINMSGDIHIVIDTVEEVKSHSKTSVDKEVQMNEKKLLDALRATRKNKTSPISKISSDILSIKLKKVPEILSQHEKFGKYYRVKELSIGVVNAKFEALFKLELKIRLTTKFVEEIGISEVCLLDEIKKSISVLEEFFSEGMLSSTMYNGYALATLLFLDGCSILQFIIGYATGRLRELGIGKAQAASIQQDLFLLENQVPFRVLTLLINLMESPIKQRLQFDILDFVVANNIVAFDPWPLNSLSSLSQEQVSEFFKNKEPIHLLHLLHSILVFGNDLFTKSNCDTLSIFKVSDGSKKDPFLASQYFDGSRICFFRNIQELKYAGIKLKPSKYCQLSSIIFDTRFYVSGHLKLPSLIVDDSTACKLLNLVAYEMSLDNYDSNCVVTSFIKLLNLLIDSEHDVKDLKAGQVLCNRLRTDAEVAQLFDTLGSSDLAPPSDVFFHVKYEIQKHCKKRRVIWIAQVCRFMSVRIALPLWVAMLFLFLTFIKTWYIIFPKK